MKKRRQDEHSYILLKKIVGVVGICAVFALCGLGAYGITTLFYSYMGYHLNDLVKVLIHSVLNCLLFIGVGIIISFFTMSRHRGRFQPLIDALRRIAMGDFRVNLDIKLANEWGELVDGINHVAEQLNEMEKLRQEFISNVSHEIQSPLTSISGFARALHNERLRPEERIRYLEIIESESKRLSKISDNLLKLTALEGIQHDLERKRYRLDTQLRALILASEPQWMAKEIEMDIDLEKVEIVADEDMLSQVWTNLLGNSIKFTEAGGKISVKLKTVNGEVLVKITDTGIGISKENQERIFERFFKADPSRNRTNSGSGLGLAIVKKIIDLHHATIVVESEEGKGTTFTITFIQTA
ncbi:two-component sensor histidine kinase [Brevibacillus brevis NBRC 100599]|uniref:histidine kinase n=1 Tax=Brevibacillus brevis (strain 47 / JCM 6285 / NBRC 100599) TaxID=358681 RepID=C0ZHP6_BREBN|nr:HAMP domain-containing sensor histidine kinase [Brevibacillus brevis]BAH45170.1 two-component sensor histidine kinase [Brevibacillus brevis NBRC 100599]